jgi:hypothetical protein
MLQQQDVDSICREGMHSHVEMYLRTPQVGIPTLIIPMLLSKR